MQVFNIPISQYNINVLNSSYSSVFTQNSDGKSYVAALTNLSAGQYYFELSGTPTASSWEFPYAFQLYFSSTVGIEETSNYFKCSNYPNPFNKSTTIAFTLIKSDFVSIKIYDIYGQLISVLSNEQMKEGEHKINFDGSTLSSGIYFYTIQSGDKIESHKLIIDRKSTRLNSSHANISY